MDFARNFICVLLTVLQIAIVARALVSWIPSLRPDSPIVRFLNEITEPVIAPLRQIVPRVGMLDITPLIAIIALGILQRIAC